MRPIDADKVMDALYDAGIELYRSEYEEFQARLDKIPTIDPETLRPTAHWVFGSTMGHSWMKCSRCLVSQDGQTAVFGYCPNCGARMVNADE